MTLYAFVINGEPKVRDTLEAAQAAVEDHYIDRGYSHLEWGEEGDDRFGAYLWGFGLGWNEPAPREDRLIWELKNVGPSTEVSQEHSGLGPMELCAAELTMTVRTRTGKTEFLRCYSAEDWEEDRLRPHLITTFAVRAGNELAQHLSKEGS